MGDFAEEIQSTFPNEKIKAILNIKFTASYLDNLINTWLRPYNISEQQYNILRILKGAGKAITVKNVKDRMIQKSPNSTRLMDKLCDKKLISRTRCESDRRVVYVKITKDGLQLLKAIKLEKLNELADKISEEEATKINKILDKLR